MSATEDLRDARGADVDVKAEGENPMLVVLASPPETKRPAPHPATYGGDEGIVGPGKRPKSDAVICASDPKSLFYDQDP